MSPAPDLEDGDIILNSSPNPVINLLSSSDELGRNPFNEHEIDLGSLAMESMESIDLSDDEPTTLTEDPIPVRTTVSAPSTPTGERDPPTVFRRSSTSAPTNTELPLAEVKDHVNVTTNTVHTDSSGFIDTFFGCLKPIFSAVNKIGENIKSARDSSAISKPADDWDIPIDSIMDDLVLIGSGVEGPVYRAKVGGHTVACKRVKCEEETNIKHLRKLNHVNIIKFRGVSVSTPLFYIVMEYCAYGSLYEVLKRRHELNSYTKPTQALDWAKQIANGVNYLHTNKIVHRDLKSPNILIADNYVLKISDFGTSKQLAGKHGQFTSFNGTSAWMAPEVIRKEPCSEKVDVWAFGVVLWEILTCEIPYHNMDTSAVMWGVAKGTLSLPVQPFFPDGFKLLMTMCWNRRPSNRPAFPIILKHLAVSEPTINIFEQEQEYAELIRAWLAETDKLSTQLPTIDISSTVQMNNEELMRKRKEELQHITDIRQHYSAKLEQVNSLYMELSSLMMQLQKREQEIKKKERLLNIQNHSTSGHSNTKKKSITSLSEARKRSLQIIKAASFYPNDSIIKSHILSTTKSTNKLSNQQASVGSSKNVNPNPINNKAASPVIAPTVVNNSNSPSNKTAQRRKKGPGHRRNNSKGSATSWTPPSLSAIADQEQKRVIMSLSPNTIEETCSATSLALPTVRQAIPVETTKPPPLPSISADVDAKLNMQNRQLNPKNLKLDLTHSVNSQSTPMMQQRTATVFTYAVRKSSSSDPEDVDDNQHPNSARQRRRRILNLNPSKVSSPSTATIRSNRSISIDQTTPKVEEAENTNTVVETKNDTERPNDSRRYPRSVSFHLPSTTTNDRSPSYQQRKIFNRQKLYSSSEEGEVEEVPSDNLVLDDQRYRAKHEGRSREANVLFSSESEIYNERNNRSPSWKNEGAFSDEGGHLSDDRPASRESLMNSEPET